MSVVRYQLQYASGHRNMPSTPCSHVSDLLVMFCNLPTCLPFSPRGCESEMVGRGPFSFVRHILQDPTHLGVGSQQVFVDGRKARRLGGRERGREEGKEEWGNEGKKGGREGKWLQGCHWIGKLLKSLSHLSEHLQPLVITFASFSLWTLCQHGGPVPIISFWCHVWCIHSILRWAIGNAISERDWHLMGSWLLMSRWKDLANYALKRLSWFCPLGPMSSFLRGCTI